MEKEKINEMLNNMEEARAKMAPLYEGIKEFDSNLVYLTKFLKQRTIGWQNVLEYSNKKIKSFKCDFMEFSKFIEVLENDFAELQEILSEEENPPYGEFVNLRIDDIPELTERARHACKRVEINTLGDFVIRISSKKDLLDIKNVGVKTSKQIIEVMSKYGIKLE